MRWLALVALATVASAIPDMFMGRRKGGFTSHLHEKLRVDPSELASAAVGSSNITQILDHFDDKNTDTWEQRYFFNHQFAKEDSNVNILYLSGEQIGSVAAIVGTMYSYVYYAQQMNADLYSLEHRFYGGSRPTDDTSVDNLKYLSSRQAIEDIAEFIRQINEEKGTPQKWITVGGSYAGALSAWFRLIHPELVSGAVASSGPILAQMDFYGYLQTVDVDFAGVGGLCYSQISDGLEKARELLQSEEGRANLTDIFQITPPLADYETLTEYDKDTFFGNLIQPFAGSAQYGLPSLDTLCQFFTANGPEADPLEAFALISNDWSVNFTETVDELSGTAYKGDISLRLWIYQTCTEFGYFQSTNRGTNVFGQTQSSNSYIEFCVQLFGIEADEIQKNIDATNEHYGERDYYAGTNVIFSHGTQDPWSFLTKKTDPAHESVIILEVEGGAHCADIGLACTYPGIPCTDNMKEIQTLTLETMQKWVDPGNVVPDRVDIKDNVGQRPDGFDPIVDTNSKTAEKVPVSTMLRAERAISETSAFSRKVDFSKWNRFTGKSGKGLRAPEASAVEEQSDTAGKDYFEQTWDHFNLEETRTFKQKWYYNYEYGSKNAPNFLMIGGEGPESNYFITENVALVTYAKAVGANLFDLEHRYYGESKLGTNDLQYLTSAQALYDIATFIKTQTANQKLTGPWITFGGSYPGALAAWSREWFPELILGAVGSSGPVLAKNDFYEYLEVVESVVKRQSQNCYDRTTEAFKQLRDLAETPEGRATIQEKFRLSPEWTSDPEQTISDLDMNNVFSALIGMYMGTVQYNDVAWNDVTALCAPFEDDSLEPLDALRKLKIKNYGLSALSSDYMADLNYLKNLKNYVDGHSRLVTDNMLASVLWTWQTCNEFGYYQSTDYGEGIFGMPVPLNFYIVMCEQVFDLNMDHVVEGISETNYQYGGRHRYNTTNVVLPNGDGDPWHALGIVEQGDLDESVVPVLIKGTSHCADMYGADPADPPELTQSRITILENIKKWIGSVPPPPTDGAPIDTTEAPVDTTEALTTTAPPPPITTSSVATVSTTAHDEETTASTTTAPTTTSTAAPSGTVLLALVSFLFAMM